MATARMTATATGVTGRPVAISSPRNNQQAIMPQTPHDQYDGGFLASLLCGGGSDNAFLMCDGAQSNEVDFDINPTGTYVAVHTKQWELACDRVKIYPREASMWVVRYGSPESAVDNAPSGVGRSASHDVDHRNGAAVAATSPRSAAGSTAAMTVGAKTLRWRMLPLHASLLFGAPIEVIKTLLKIYPAGISAHDDQGMLPLHLAFRAGSPEEIVLLLLEKHPEAIERADYKGRLPSMLAPKDAMSYGDSIAEAFVRGPSFYYWAARVATADRLRSEMAMTAKIKQLEASARTSAQRDREMLNNTEQQLTEEIMALSGLNVDLKERLTWYETKYDGAEEKEKVLVDHTNSLAERLRLTSLSEEHLATKLAKLEARLKSKEAELDNSRSSSTEDNEALRARIIALEQGIITKEHKKNTMAEKLEKRILESNEMKGQFEKERELFGKQIDASKDCLMELIASSKEDKRIFEKDSRELRKQLQELQAEVQMANVSEKRTFEEESQELRRQLMAIQSEVQKASETTRKASSIPPKPVILPQSLEDRLDNLQKEVANNTNAFMSRVDVLEVEEQKEREWVIQRQASSARKIEERLDNLQKVVGTQKIEDRLDSLQKEVANARSFMNHGSSGMVRNAHLEPGLSTSASALTTESSVVHQQQQQSQHNRHQYQNLNHSQSSSSMRSARLPIKSPRRRAPVPSPSPRHHQREQRREPEHTYDEEEEEEEPFDTYISTKSIASSAGISSREESEVIGGMTVFSHESDVDAALALGELTEEQRLALESLDLGGTREEIIKSLAKVPGLTMNQVNLLVDVASSLMA